jgi:hypothetical protein
MPENNDTPIEERSCLICENSIRGDLTICELCNLKTHDQFKRAPEFKDGENVSGSGVW